MYSYHSCGVWMAFMVTTQHILFLFSMESLPNQTTELATALFNYDLHRAVASLATELI